MSDSQASTDRSGQPGTDEKFSALFAQLVMQQVNMAMMLLGKVQHPETGQVVKDLSAAQLFIDQLEMIEVKTRGNLTKDEAGLLKQSLMSLRLAFVEAVEAPSAKPETASAGQSQSQTPPEAKTAAPSSAPAEEHRTKFSKKY